MSRDWCRDDAYLSILKAKTSRKQAIVYFVMTKLFIILYRILRYESIVKDHIQTSKRSWCLSGVQWCRLRSKNCLLIVSPWL